MNFRGLRNNQTAFFTQGIAIPVFTAAARCIVLYRHGNKQAKWYSCLSTRHRRWFDYLLGHTEDFKSVACSLSSFLLGVDGWVQGNGSCAVLSLTCYQCNIHCESSHSRRNQAQVGARRPLTTLPNWVDFFWASCYCPLLGRTRSRGRCWAVIRLFRRPEPSGRAVHGEVEGLGTGGQHGQWFVLLRHTHRLQRRTYPICTSKSGNIQHRCGSG